MVPLTFTLMITSCGVHRGDSSSSPLGVRHMVTMVTMTSDMTLNHVTKDGSALRGTRASIFASDEESG